jgi:hypothetical protein
MQVGYLEAAVVTRGGHVNAKESAPSEAAHLGVCSDSRESLRKFVSEVFQVLNIEASFEILQYGVEIHPTLAKLLQVSSEYMVCCNDVSVRNDLSCFMDKEILAANGTIYWFEGDDVPTRPKGGNDSVRPPNPPDPGSAPIAVRLPEWLDALIYQTMQARYAPSGIEKGFDRNLDLSKNELLVYLGTYFPRSYAETLSIFNNLFENSIVFEEMERRSVIDICAVGSGTGGDLLGLLASVNSRMPNVANVNITAIDGNREAQMIADSIIEKAAQQFGFTLQVTTINHTFTSIRATKKFLSELNAPFDFILTSKMLNEMISTGKEACANSYRDFAMAFLPLLKQSGICLILDITSKPDHISDFYPQLLNEQVNLALKDMPEFRTLLPLPCSLFEQDCSQRCFTQRTFYVTHSRKANDKSKVCYRVVAKKGIVDKIVDKIVGTSCEAYSITDSNERFCYYSISPKDGLVRSGFVIENQNYSSDTA